MLRDLSHCQLIKTMLSAYRAVWAAVTLAVIVLGLHVLYSVSVHGHSSYRYTGSDGDGSVMGHIHCRILITFEEAHPSWILRHRCYRHLDNEARVYINIGKQPHQKFAIL